MAAGNRVQNEFELEQSGGGTTATMQLLEPGLGTWPGMDVFVGIRKDCTDAFEALTPSVVADKADDVMDLFENLLPPDILAAALRKLGVKAKAIQANPKHLEDWGSVRASAPGFRIAVVRVPDFAWEWLDR